MNAQHNTLRTLKPGQRLQTKAADGGDPLLAAVAEHAERFEKAAAASALQIKALQDDKAEMAERLAGLEQEFVSVKSAGSFAGGPAAVVSPVAEFVKSAQLQAMRDGANTTGRVSLKTAGLKLLTKAISNTGVGQSGDQSYNVQPDRWAGLGNNAQRRFSLFDVLPSLPVSTATFEYMQLNGYSNAAAVQAKEGDAKAAGTVPTQVITANVATIAHYVKASQQVLDDAPALSLQLNNLLSYGVMAKGESQLINGAGGAGQIKGLLPYATAYTPTATVPADMIGEAITALQASGWNPGVVVLNPTDWFAMTSAKSSGSGEYQLGSPRDPSPPSLWSIPVITSASLAAGTAIVLDVSQVALLDRQEVVVATSRDDGSNFTTNMVTVLAEGRMGLAVFSPGAVLSVDLAP